MDNTTHVLMERFIAKYLDPNVELEIIDIGSHDVNGTFKELFYSSKWHYTGLDIVAGDNVDVVVAPYDYNLNKKFDVIVSGSTIEHIADLKEWSLQVSRLFKPNTIVWFCAPLEFPCTHRHPKDCWRVMEDGMSWIMKDIMKLEMLELFIHDRMTFGIAKNKGE